MPEIVENELIIVGGGPGGYAAAFHAADKGMKVTLIDAAVRPGGTCLHVGCIPSKALLHSAKLVTDARDAGQFGIHFSPPKIDINGVRGHWQKVVDGLSKSLLDLCKRRKVEFVNSRATFVDSRTVQLTDGSQRQFGQCIIATGSVPILPGPLGLKSPRVMDSTAALKLEDIPTSLLVVGGGYIGLELGYVYAALGSKVTVVEMLDGLLPGVDRDLVVPLHKRLEKLFEKIYLSTKVANLEDTGKSIRATLEGAEVTDKQPVFDRVLVAVGRKPNSAGLGLEKTRVQLDPSGFVVVDEKRRTVEEQIYAIGDVAGEPMLAHKALHEGKIAVEAIAGEPAAYDFRAIPAVVFTDPEIAWCGLTETEAKKQKREVKIARFPWGASGRAATLGRTEGATKLVFDPETEIILGVGIVGTEAGEMISEGCVAVEMGATASDLSLTMHPHPTLSETIGEAAESLHGQATHMFRPRKETAR
jgi:dihydrolipoamide dehydrogenase